MTAAATPTIVGRRRSSPRSSSASAGRSATTTRDSILACTSGGLFVTIGGTDITTFPKISSSPSSESGSSLRCIRGPNPDTPRRAGTGSRICCCSRGRADAARLRGAFDCCQPDGVDATSFSQVPRVARLHLPAAQIRIRQGDRHRAADSAARASHSASPPPPYHYRRARAVRARGPVDAAATLLTPIPPSMLSSLFTLLDKSHR